MAKRKPITKKSARRRRSPQVAASRSSRPKSPSTRSLFNFKKVIQLRFRSLSKTVQKYQKQLEKKRLQLLKKKPITLKQTRRHLIKTWRSLATKSQTGCAPYRAWPVTIMTSVMSVRELFYTVDRHVAAFKANQIKFLLKPQRKKSSRPSAKNTITSGTIFRASWFNRWQSRWRHLRRQIHKNHKRYAKSNLAFRRKVTKQWHTFSQNTQTRLTAFVRSLVGEVPLKVAHILTYPFRQVWHVYRWQTVIALTFTVLILGGAFGLYQYIFKDLPTAEELVAHQPIVSTKILDRHGELLFSIYQDENRTPVPLSEIPPYLINATIAIEDQNFWHHLGFDPQGIVRAIVSNLKGEKVQGGSTITQQLVKNTLLNSDQTLQRKIKEVIVAITIEGNFSKTEILERYFNEIPYGGSTYGAEEAAQRFFGKHARELTLGESAFLAGLPAAPTAYSPYGPTPELAYARQAEVLRRMVEEHYITEEEAAAARQQPLQFRNDVIDIKAPHFVMYVKQLLAEQYGEQVLTQGGLEVVTSLDLDIQHLAEDAVTTEVNRLQRLRVGNGAALVTNPKTGEILAMVGSKDYFDFEHDGQVNVTLRPRQPGSSIKPLTYATAFERGDTPATTIDDSPITYHIPGSPPYSPRNYDGKYHGRVALREALGSSYNIPAVKLLAKIGINNLIDKAETVGISTWKDRRRFGLSLTLGGGEVLMTNMAKVYGTFANQGVTVDLNPILQVSTFEGETLYRNDCALDSDRCPGRRTFDPKVAAQITDVLSDNRARTPAFGPRSVLVIPGQEVAVKTGTTNNLKDNWTDGYTSDYVVLSWVGNNDGTPMSYVASGITGASPIWNTIMTGLLDPEKPHTFSVPEGLVKVKICSATGTLPCQGCPSVREELFTAGTEPTRACSPSWFTPVPTPDPNDPNRDQILEGFRF